MRFLILVALAFAPSAAHAHPVAYQGSVGFMGYLSKDMTDLEINYSVRHWWAPSVQLLRFTEGTSRPSAWLAKLNALGYRWNGENGQGNLYLRGGGGWSHLERGGGVYTFGFTADIENRRLYALVQADSLRRGSRGLLNTWKARVGFAPYVTSFDRLHGWLILEASRKSEGDGRVNLVPTLRFFIDNLLWEVGASLKGDTHLNYIIHL